MFKLTRTQLIYFIFIGCIVLLASLSLGRMRSLVCSLLKIPLSITALVRDEAGAFIFFHQNHIERRRLSGEVEALRSSAVAQEELRRENVRLKNMLVFKEESAHQFAAARVIGHSADSWTSSVIIDKGARSGIASGMAVVTPGGFAGRVAETTDTSSTVLLVSDPNLGVSGLIQRSRQEGLVSGTLGSYLLMRYLPEDPDIQQGDIVVTSGFSLMYPKGLAIGTVVDIVKDLSGLSIHAVLKPSVDLPNLEEVIVIVS